LKHKRSAAELILQVVIPALFLLFGALAPLLGAALLSPYLVLCISGLLALVACLLWGWSLCARMVREGARAGLIFAALLLTLWSVFGFLSGLLAEKQTASGLLGFLAAAASMLLPAALYRAFRAAMRAPDEQKADPAFWILLAVGAVLGVVILASGLTQNVLLLVVATYGWKIWLIAGVAGVQLMLPLLRFSRRAVPALVLWAVEAAVLVCAVFGFGLRTDVLHGALPLLVFGFCELCCAGELLPDGRHWAAVLQKATFPLQLMNKKGEIVYGSEHAVALSFSHRAAILNNRLRLSRIMERDMQFSAVSVRGGFSLQQKDLRDLRTLQSDLEAVTKNQEEIMALLSRGHEMEQELQKVTAKNQFFARQAAKIQEKTDRASLLLRCAAAPSPEPGFRRAVVTRANLLVTYIQQLGLLLQAAKEAEALPVYHLRTALEASAKAASDAGARCRVYHVAQGQFPAETLIALYDLCELLLEEVLSGAEPMVEIRLRNEQTGLRLILTVKESALENFRTETVLEQAAALGGTARFAAEGRDVSVFIEFVEGGAGNA